MKDTGYPVRKAYNTLITGLGYTTYDMKAKDDAVKPYIILGSQTSQSQNTKNTFDYVCTINIDIITSFEDGFGGRKSLDLIVDAILTAAIPSPGVAGITISGFNIVATKKLIDFDFEPVQNDTQTIYRRVITFEHTLEQL